MANEVFKMFATIGAKYDQFLTDVKKVEAKGQEIEKKKITQKVDADTSGAHNALSALGTHIGAIAGIAAGALAGISIVNFVKGAVSSTEDFGKAVVKMQRLTGETAEESSTLAYAAQRYGVDITTMSMGVKTLAKDLENGGAKMDKWGIASKDANGHNRDFMDLLGDIAQKSEELGPGLENDAMMVELLGKSGMGLIPMLADGKDGLAGMREEVKKYGLEMDENGIHQSKEFAKSQAHLDLSMMGLKKTIGEWLIPILTRLGTWFADVGIPAVRHFFDALGPIWNMPDVDWKTKLGLTADALGPMLSSMGISKDKAQEVIDKIKEIGGAVNTAYEDIKSVFSTVSENWDTAKGIIEVATGLMVAQWLLVKTAAIEAAVAEAGAATAGGVVGGAGMLGRLLAIGAAPAVAAAALGVGAGYGIEKLTAKEGGPDYGPENLGLPKAKADQDAATYGAGGEQSANYYNRGFQKGWAKWNADWEWRQIQAHTGGQQTGAAVESGVKEGVDQGRPVADTSMRTTLQSLADAHIPFVSVLAAAGLALADSLHAGMNDPDRHQSAVQTLFNLIVTGIKALFGIHSPAASMVPLGASITDGFIVGMLSKNPVEIFSKFIGGVGGMASKLFGSMFGGGGGASQWMATALEALKITGSPIAWLPLLMAQINSESGGNPNAINLTDSNAQRGDPSVGLLQNIGSAFQGRLPDFLKGRSPFDPLASLVAGLNYMKSTYGSPYGVWGEGHGYATGGISLTPAFAEVSARGPELHLTKDNIREFGLGNQPINIYFEKGMEFLKNFVRVEVDGRVQNAIVIAKSRVS